MGDEDPRRAILLVLSMAAALLLWGQLLLAPLGANLPWDSPAGSQGDRSADADLATEPEPVVALKQAPDSAPNVVVILSDDQNIGTMQYMPQTRERIFEAGVTFEQAYISTPVCCPSRAGVLTGQYAHNHGVLNNFMKLQGETVVHDLKRAGYTTGHVGKFLNTWHGEVRLEYDYFAAHGGATSDYYNAELFVNGRWEPTDQYITYAFRDHALTFIDQAVEQEAPFLLMFWPNAPHGPAQPAPEHQRLYHDLELPFPPSMNEEDLSDKPAWLQDREPLDASVVGRFALRLDQLRTLAALDEAVSDILDRLDHHGIANDTLVMYLSDNGILNGEHRLVDKYWPYEESVHVPFGLRYPPLVDPGQVEDRLVSNIDIAPTLYELARAKAHRSMDGRSLVPLLQGATDWREELYMEAWPRDAPAWQGVHTGSHVYIEWSGDRPELYDLATDPYQLENRAGDPAYADVEQDLLERLEALRPPWKRV